MANRPYPPRIPREDLDDLHKPDDIESNALAQISTGEIKDTERYPSSEHMNFPSSSHSGQSHSNSNSNSNAEDPLVPLAPVSHSRDYAAQPGVYPPMGGSNAGTSGSQYASEGRRRARTDEMDVNGVRALGTGEGRGANFL
jgi:hypothetical protein